jgi:ribonuclease MRP protein subunit SNM1
MASSDLMARLRYLHDSAHLLATTAPATSKYLMSNCNSLMFENGIEQSESHKGKACGACGTIMILGWGGKLEVETQRARRGSSTPKRTMADRVRAMIYRCESCGRQTRINISAPSKNKASSVTNTKHSSNIAQASNTSLLPSSPTLQQPKSNVSSTASSTNKKRTKARKQGGLEAVIARQRAADSSRSSGFGLDLLDFMKKT